MPKHPTHIMELARRGAEQRWQELQAEMAQLVRTFPHLGSLAGRKGGQVSKPGHPSSANNPLSAKVQVRRRSRMSAAARKAVSIRMKKYWAARRAAKK